MGRREARERQGDAGILSLDHAAELLPMSDDVARAWLQEQGLVVEMKGRLTVEWGEVLEARRRLRERLTTAARTGLRRERLD